MTTGIAEPSPAPIPEPPAKNSFQRIAGVLFAPAETFRDIARKPDIIVPLLLLLIANFIATAVILPRTDWTGIQAMQAEAMKKRSPNLSDSDIERMQKMGGAVNKVTAWLGPVFWVAGYAIVALLLMAGCRLLGGEGTYKQAFSATLYAWIPIAIFRIVRAVVVGIRGSVDPMEMGTVVKSNPAFLVDFKEQPAAFALLGAVDLFSIWTVILLVIGFSAVSRLSKGKTAAIVISLWLALVVIGVAFAMYGAAQMKG